MDSCSTIQNYCKGSLRFGGDDLKDVILSKLDGTAKGGIALAIRQELEVPVWYIGVGEGIDDLQPFEAKSFVEALF